MQVSLNMQEYRKEVIEMIRLFYNNEMVTFNDENFDMKIFIGNGKISIGLESVNLQKRYDINENIRTNLKKALFYFFSEDTGIIPDWGILLGIRPSKIALNLLQKGINKENIIDYYVQKYLTTKSKAKLCYDVAVEEEKYVCVDQKSVSIYVGMPFCPTRCSYCSFTSNSIKGNDALAQRYLYALKQEIEALSAYISKKELKIESIYFGGGTPTAVNNDQFKFIMNTIDNCFKPHKEIKEYTVECGRPDSINKDKFEIMKDSGVTRISINPQTMNNETLKRIGRQHSSEEIIEKYNLARQMGFENINMDIIIGLPGEGVDDVIKTCEEISKLDPDSITIHGMSLKRASKLHEDRVNNKNLNLKDKTNEVVRMYEAAKKLAERLKMKPYYMYRQKNIAGNMENIGYSKVHKECIYNVQMIEEKQIILAFGADAVSKLYSKHTGKINRIPNIKDVNQYIDRIDEIIQSKIKGLDEIFPL